MITVRFNNVNYECEKALKGDNYVRLFDSNGATVAAFEGVNDFTDFTISGGEWSEPLPTDDCPVAVVREGGAVCKSPHESKVLESIGAIFDMSSGAVIKVFVNTHEAWEAYTGDKTNVLFIPTNDKLVGSYDVPESGKVSEAEIRMGKTYKIILWKVVDSSTGTKESCTIILSTLGTYSSAAFGDGGVCKYTDTHRGSTGDDGQPSETGSLEFVKYSPDGGATVPYCPNGGVIDVYEIA